MAEHELRRLSRAELIEIIYELQKQNEQNTAQIAALQARLDDRTLRIAESGSLAEAAIRVNGVLEAAQAAADQYLASLHAANADTGEKMAAAEQQRDEILLQANQRADELIRKAEQEAQRIVDDANAQAAAAWDSFEQKAQELIRLHSELRTLRTKDA